MIPDRVLSANVDACCEGGRHRSVDRGPGVVAAAVPRHGTRRLPGHPDDDGRHARAGRAAGLHGPARQLDAVDLRLPAAPRRPGPNFSWVLATRALRRMDELDLSSLTLALSGAEPVDPDAVEAFVAAAEPFGFTAGGVFPAFGMAEVAIGGSFPQRGRGLVCDTVDRDRPRARPRRQAGRDRRSRRPRAQRPPAAAARHPGARARDPHRRARVARRAARTPRRRAADPGHVGDARLLQAARRHRRAVRPTAGCAPATSAYMVDGELVLCGRIKDVIIVGGRNVFPEDIERAVGVVDGVRAGNVIAFGMEGYKGKESVVVVAETKAAPTTRRPAPGHPPPDAGGGAACPPRDVMLVQPSTLPKTSSGKLQRSLCRERVPRGASCDRLTPIPVFGARDRHRGHDLEHEIESSACSASFEHPGGVPTAIVSASAGRVTHRFTDRASRRRRHGGASRRSHDRRPVRRSLATPWASTSATVAPDADDVVPDVYAEPASSRGRDASRPTVPARVSAASGGGAETTRARRPAPTTPPARPSTAPWPRPTPSLAGAVRWPTAVSPAGPPRLDVAATAATASSTTPPSPPSRSGSRRRAQSPCSTSTTTSATAPGDRRVPRRRARGRPRRRARRAGEPRRGHRRGRGRWRDRRDATDARCPAAPTRPRSSTPLELASWQSTRAAPGRADVRSGRHADVARHRAQRSSLTSAGSSAEWEPVASPLVGRSVVHECRLAGDAHERADAQLAPPAGRGTVRAGAPRRRVPARRRTRHAGDRAALRIGGCVGRSTRP